MTGIRVEITSQLYEHEISAKPPDTGYWDLFPSMHATYRFDNANVRLALTSGLARPNYLHLFDAEYPLGDGEFVRGNPELRPMRSYGADLMLEVYPRHLGAISAGLFAKRLLDPSIEHHFKVVDGVRNFSVIEPLNGESGNVFGFEASVVQQLSVMGMPSLRHFGIYANYAYAHSRIDYGNIRLGDGPMLNSARHTGNMGLFYDSPRVSFTFSYTYRSPLLRSVSDDPRDDVWWQSERRADISVKVDLTGQAHLFLKTNNLTDETQREVYGDPYDQGAAPLRFRKREEYGRTALVGLAYSL